MIRWRIKTTNLGGISIQYDKRFFVTGEPLWFNITSTGAPNMRAELFPTFEDAEQVLELLMDDFGGYRVG